MRGLIPLLAGACATPNWQVELESDDPMLVAAAFVDHRSFREAALLASLDDPVRDYGEARLAHYTSDWDALDVSNAGGLATTLPATEADLLALGRQAFERVPLQPSRRWEAALHGEPGLGIDAATLVLTPVAGAMLPALTCASCHSATLDDGQPVLGLGNPTLDLSEMWPLGTVDPTADGTINPTTVADLRAVRFQSALHASGTLHNSLSALAVRIDTLMITTFEETSRPPRVIPVAIAAWLWSLGDTLPVPADDHRGAAVFDQACGECHGLDGVADPVDVDVVGTDPAAASSSTRGTGRYRVPSLRGLGQRSVLLHDGSVRSLDDLLDPEREGGHRFGHDLDASMRDLLLDYLRAL